MEAPGEGDACGSGATDGTLVRDTGAARGLLGVLADVSSSDEGTSKMSKSGGFLALCLAEDFLLGNTVVVLSLFWILGTGGAGVVARDLAFGLTAVDFGGCGRSTFAGTWPV